MRSFTGILITHSKTTLNVANQHSSLSRQPASFWLHGNLASQRCRLHQTPNSKLRSSLHKTHLSRCTPFAAYHNPCRSQWFRFLPDCHISSSNIRRHLKCQHPGSLHPSTKRKRLGLTNTDSLKSDQPRVEQNGLLSPKRQDQSQPNQRFELDEQRPRLQSTDRFNDNS